MRGIEIHNKAEQIEVSGDWIEKNALNAGKKGVLSLHPSGEKGMEAYRTGLNLFFQSNGLKDYIVAEEVITGDISLQQGFGDRFRIGSTIFSSEEVDSFRQIYTNKYQKTLRQLRSLQNAGIDVGYSSYLRGALIAIRVREVELRDAMKRQSDLINSQTVPGEIWNRGRKLNYDVIMKDRKSCENYLQSMVQERAILEMALKDPTYPIDLSFTPGEIKWLEFLKRLKQEGKI